MERMCSGQILNFWQLIWYNIGFLYSSNFSEFLLFFIILLEIYILPFPRLKLLEKLNIYWMEFPSTLPRISSKTSVEKYNPLFNMFSSFLLNSCSSDFFRSLVLSKWSSTFAKKEFYFLLPLFLILYYVMD